MEQPNIIHFFGVDRQYQNLREEILDVTDRVYTSGKVLDGSYTREFERKMAVRCQRDFAITTNSGTQALIFALQCITPAGDILIPNISFSATLNSVMMTEHMPKIVDVDYAGMMDLESYPSTLNDDSIRAIMYVNLYGNMIDYDKLKLFSEFFGKKPTIIEDAAQSFGAYYKNKPSGSFGDISILSFDPTKNLNNYGSGGMILTDDYNTAEMILNFRDNGKISGNTYPGTNSKMSESDCAQMLVKLNHFDSWQKRRTDIADHYIEKLQPYIEILTPNQHVEHSWHKFVVRHTNRDKLRNHLSIKGIETKIHYAEPLDTLQIASMIPMEPDYDLYYSHRLAKECLSLPIYPELTDGEVEYIVETVKDFYR